MHYNPDTRFLTFVARCMGHVSGHENTARLCAPARGSEDRRCNTRCIRVRAYGRCASATAPIADVRAQYSSQKGLPAVGMEVYDVGRQHIDGENSAELRNVFACVQVGSALARHDVSTRSSPKAPARSCMHILRPLEFQRALAFLDTAGDPFSCQAGAWPRAGSAANKTWIGRVAFVEPEGLVFVNAIGRRSLAPAAGSPRRAAASAGNAPANSPTNSAASAANGDAASAANPNAAPAAAAASAAAAATAASAAAAAAPGFMYQAPKRSLVLLVEDVERRQANVVDFLFTEGDFVTRCIRCLRSVRCRHGRCRCAAH